MKVIGVGDNVVDIYADIDTMFPGGNALNFAVYAKKLGFESAYLGVFGSDRAAEHVKAVLNELEIDISYCRTYEGENGYAVVDLVEGDRKFIGGNKGGVARDYPLNLSHDDLDYISQYDLVHSSCYSFIEEELYKLGELAAPISYDFSNEISSEYLKQVCPHIDFAFLSCGHLTEAETKDKLIEANNYGVSLSLGTRGAKGALTYVDNKFYSVAAKEIEPLDTLGAGDSLITVFLLELLRSGSKNEEVILRALDKGVEYAAETCQLLGAFGKGLTKGG